MSNKEQSNYYAIIPSIVRYIYISLIVFTVAKNSIYVP